ERDRVQAAGRPRAGADGIAAGDRVAWRSELEHRTVAEVGNVQLAVGAELHAERDVPVESDRVLEAAIRPEDVDVVVAREVERRRVDVSRRVGGDAFRVARLASR